MNVKLSHFSNQESVIINIFLKRRCNTILDSKNFIGNAKIIKKTIDNHLINSGSMLPFLVPILSSTKSAFWSKSPKPRL